MSHEISQERLCQLAVLPDDALLRVREAAALEAVSMSTAWRRIRAGIWPVVRIGGTTRIPLGALRRARGV